MNLIANLRADLRDDLDELRSATLVDLVRACVETVLVLGVIARTLVHIGATPGDAPDESDVRYGVGPAWAVDVAALPFRVEATGRAAACLVGTIFLAHVGNLAHPLAQMWWTAQCALLIVEPLHLLPRVRARGDSA